MTEPDEPMPPEPYDGARPQPVDGPQPDQGPAEELPWDAEEARDGRS